jgi:transketolase C-terminal domain/subunit
MELDRNYLLKYASIWEAEIRKIAAGLAEHGECAFIVCETYIASARLILRFSVSQFVLTPIF